MTNKIYRAFGIVTGMEAICDCEPAYLCALREILGGPA